MYHGMMGSGRGIESCIDLLEKDDKLGLVLLGDGDNGYLKGLVRRASDKGVEERILFCDAVPQQELWKYIGAVDLDMLLLPMKISSKSYYLSLPNKFFESIQSGTPFVTTRQPELSRMIKRYKAGILCDSERTEDVRRALQPYITAMGYRNQLRSNTQRAAEQLCWENESLQLRKAYQNVMRHLS